MKKFSGERGAVSGYVIGIVFLVLVIGGGVILIKGLAKKDSDNSIDKKTDTTKEEESPKPIVIENPAVDEKKEEEKPVVSTPSPVATQPPIASQDSDQYPEKFAEKVPSTGPEDIMSTTFLLVVIAGVLYAAWNYRGSRVAVKKTLIK